MGQGTPRREVRASDAPSGSSLDLEGSLAVGGGHGGRISRDRRVAQQELGEAEHRVHGRAYLVRHFRQEQALGTVGALSRHQRYQVHDGDNEARVGDVVVIEECRPISREKRSPLRSSSSESSAG